MLRRVADGPAIVACSSCRHPAKAGDDPDGLRGGQRLAEALRAVKAANRTYDAIAIEAMPCLFACAESCTVHLRAPGKIGYVLGRFSPDEAAATALLDYAVAYSESAFGEVPYCHWPDGVKGHFLTRMPPPGHVVAGE